MTFLTQKTRLTKQMNLYIQYLGFCTNENETFKLLDEIQFLKFKIEKISRMKMSEAFNDVKLTTEIIETKF